jgi:hypothetical protein
LAAPAALADVMTGTVKGYVQGYDWEYIIDVFSNAVYKTFFYKDVHSESATMSSMRVTARVVG